MKFNSLAFRLFATSAVWTLLVLPLAGIIIYQLYRDDVQASFDAQLWKLVNALSVDSLSPGATEPTTPPNRYEPLFEETHSGWYWQIEPVANAAGKRLVSASLATAALDSPFAKQVEADANGARWLNSTGPVGEPIRSVEIVDTLGHADGAPRYSIVVAGPIDWLKIRVGNFLTRLSTALTLAGVGLVAVTLFQVRFGLLPLRRIEQGLADVRSGKATTLEGGLPAEIEPLQLEVNALIKSNQEIIDRARTQVGNLAHALKTPLAVITNEAREDKGKLSAKVTEQAALMRDQINHYLDRARMAARVGVIGRSTEVRPVAEAIVRALERINQDRGIAISVSCPAGVQFLGEKQDIEEILGNLLDNACKWARGAVWLTVRPARRADRAAATMIEIDVEDDGKGLSDAEKEKIGKRGQRLDETKPGSGLGLSIVTDLIQSYRGEFMLRNSPRGGLSVQLKLPGA